MATQTLLLISALVPIITVSAVVRYTAPAWDRATALARAWRPPTVRTPSRRTTLIFRPARVAAPPPAPCRLVSTGQQPAGRDRGQLVRVGQQLERGDPASGDRQRQGGDSPAARLDQPARASVDLGRFQCPVPSSLGFRPRRCAAAAARPPHVGRWPSARTALGPAAGRPPGRNRLRGR